MTQLSRCLWVAIVSPDTSYSRIFTRDIYEVFFEPPYTPYTGRNRLYSWSLPINDGRYRPRLIILKSRYTRGYPYLYIEFSIPKLLFGNNLYEIREQDFSAVVNKLLIVLEEMSVLTTADVIINAPVQKIHYSKNFILPEALL